ncbi:protein FAR1-related sequence 5 [Tanacetum coccineum]|uniref:Protein FAR1-related sequence 5 n=1 Tax=Tanacetum coccineum TaxID=301880 RepID=A0ABQ5GU81_9ASTR
MDSSHSSARSVVSYNSVSSDVAVGSSVPSDLNALSTPESFVTDSNFDTPGGTVYYIPKVSADILLVKGTVEDCVLHIEVCAKQKVYLLCLITINNHELDTGEYKHLSKTERQLTYMEQAFIVKAASVNIGATRAHHLLTGIKGSYLLVHGTTVDFKNFFRSVNCYIGDSDAQMLIHKMENRKKHADEVSKYNYREFGDVVSFDATFKTNKYKMVFVPFTAIDNHKKCVTVAAGLLKNETTKSYIWLLKAFIKAFGKAPSIVVTDQDGAMRNAIEAEFGGSKHRLCMWHITQKLPAKICAKIYDETDFKEKLNKIIWNMYIGLEEFEYRWGKLMEEFKTTSRSENGEKANARYRKVDHKTIELFVPKLKTLLKIERHASNVYTRSLFELQRESICYEMPNKKKKKPQSVDKGNDKAEENDKVDLFFKKDGLYKVLRNVGGGSAVCSCQLFVRVGILCKHIFCVFKNANVEMIPQQYILRRWTKTLIPAGLRNKRNRYSKKNVVVENYANEATSIIDHCVHLLSKDEPRLGSFVEKLKSQKKEVEADCPNPSSKNKTDNLEQLVRVPKPPVVDVNNPIVGSTKGQKKLRIKGGKEKAIEKSLKDRNSCSLCGGIDHNKRTCPRIFQGQDEVVVQKEVGQEEVLVQKEVCQEEVVQEKSRFG